MAQITPNLALTVPARGDLNWDVAMSANLYKIDGISQATLNIVGPMTSAPTVDLSKGTLCLFNLTAAVNAVTLANVPTNGQMVTFVVVQDATGNHPFAWPNGFVGAGDLTALAGTIYPNSVSIQTFFVLPSTGKGYAVTPLMTSAL